MTDTIDTQAPVDAPAIVDPAAIVAPVDAAPVEAVVAPAEVDWQTAFWDRIAAEAAVTQAK